MTDVKVLYNTMENGTGCGTDYRESREVLEERPLEEEEEPPSGGSGAEDR